MQDFSLKTLCLRFKWRISATIAMIAIGAGLELLFPLAIGYAIDGLLAGEQTAVWPLAAIGIGALVVGSLQRFYDTRIYAGIYRIITPEMVTAEQQKGTDVSGISARTGLLNEFVDFLEKVMPEIVHALVGLVGTLILIAYLDLSVFVACLILFFLMAFIFYFTSAKNYALNAGLNDEMENQVNVLRTGNKRKLNLHLKRLMNWTIRLSDLETLNFSVLFLGVIALLVYTPWVVVDKGVLQHGMVFSVLMYVLSYIESLVTCPLFIQQMIRLHEIAGRLSGGGEDEVIQSIKPKNVGKS